MDDNTRDSYIHYFDTLDEALDARVHPDGRSLREIFEECDYTCANLNDEVYPNDYLTNLYSFIQQRGQET